MPMELVVLSEDNVEYVAKATKRSEAALRKLLKSAQAANRDVYVRIGVPW